MNVSYSNNHFTYKFYRFWTLESMHSTVLAKLIKVIALFEKLYLRDNSN